MKRILGLFVAISFITTSCVGNASLWGQYLTPTPVGNVPATETVTPEPFVISTPTLGPFVLPTLTSTSTAASETFVTEVSPAAQATSTPTNLPGGPVVLYYTQSGDWLPAVAKRFSVDLGEITSPKVLPENGLLDVGTLLMIPDRRDETVQYTSPLQLLPDGEVVYSATALDFDIAGYVRDAGGYLSTYREYLKQGWVSGSGAIERSAFENSINPRLFLALLDYEARIVRGTPENKFRIDYPLGYENYRNKGVFLQLAWAANQISSG